MTEDLAKKIDQYVSGDIDRTTLMSGLSSEEVATVALELELIDDIGIAAEMSDVRAQMKDIVAPKERETKVVQFDGLYKYLGIAAAVLFMIIAYQTLQDRSHPLLEEYANIKEGLPTMMSDTENYDFDDAMTFFKEGDYKTALDRFSKIEVSKDVDQDTLDYFIGLCHFHLKGYDEAVSILDKIDKSSSYKPQSLWYVLMCYVAQEDRPLVNKQLQLILSDPDHPYIDRARSFESSWKEYSQLKFGNE